MHYLPFLLLLVATRLFAAATTPNFLIILADDLGYGDVQCYQPGRGKIATPHLDRLASGGMRFTDAHSSSSVCSPTRYTLLTGRYHWRSRLQRGIVQYLEGPLIAPERLTVAGLARRHGYRTACIGKWHLGWDWAIDPRQREHFAAGRGGAPEAADAQRAAWREVYSRPIGGGPIARGFDEYFGTDVPNWPPYAFIEGDRTVGVPSEFLPAPLLQRRLAGIGGPALPGWSLEAVLPALGERAAEFITRQAKARQPFFLYMPLTSPHTPIAPAAEWKGRSGLGDYGDFVMQTDAVVGRVLDALEQSGAAGNTMVLFTSDNGFAPIAGTAELESRGHFPSGPLRDYKASMYEGGHRVPFIVRWPGVTPPGAVSGRLVHQADLLATVADALGARLPADAGEDSVSLLPLLKGGDKPVREHAISCAASGVPTLRVGPWKYIAAGDPQAGGDAQLYHLGDDLGEKHNLAAAQPQRVAEMRALLEKLIAEGRSTPGAPQRNDVPVVRHPEAPTKASAGKKQPPKGAVLHRIVPKSPRELQSLFQYRGEPWPYLSAHRGGRGAGLPENCIATFAHTLRHTFAILEIDPRRARDGAIVVHHDETLDRTTTGTGKVRDFTLAELKALRLKDPAGQLTTFQIPTLDEAIEWARGRTVLVLDQKDVSALERAEVVTRHKAEAHVLLIVSSFRDVAAVHRLNPDIVMEVMIPTLAKAEEFDRLGVPWRNVVAFVGHVPPEDPALYTFIHGRGACCMIGTSRNLDRQALEDPAAGIAALKPGYDAFLQRGADLIETDIPALLGPLLGHPASARALASGVFQRR